MKIIIKYIPIIKEYLIHQMKDIMFYLNKSIISYILLGCLITTKHKYYIMILFIDKCIIPYIGNIINSIILSIQSIYQNVLTFQTKISLYSMINKFFWVLQGNHKRSDSYLEIYGETEYIFDVSIVKDYKVMEIYLTKVMKYKQLSPKSHDEKDWRRHIQYR